MKGLTSVCGGPARRRRAARGALTLLLWLAALALAPALAGARVPVQPAAPAQPADDASASWPSAGQNLANSRTQAEETQISPANVGKLAPKWRFTTHGEVSATPTVDEGVVYFPDWAGYLYAVNASTGQLIWQRQISEYDGTTGTVSRVSPAIYGNELILGDNAGSGHAKGANIFAVNRETGALMWIKQVDAHPAAIDTGSAELAGDEVIVGVSSDEEASAAQPTYACCTFRGSVVALDAETGKLLWRKYTVPPNLQIPCKQLETPKGCHYSGGAVWGPPSIDLETNTVYVGTGNNYSAPSKAEACEQEAEEHESSNARCTSPLDYFDSVIALNLETGALRWGHKVEGWDAYNIACAFGKSGLNWCPTGKNPDFDFGGSAPNLFTIHGKEVVGDGQKSGIYWVFNARTGRLVWDTLVGPGTGTGGVEWGTAYDGSRIYVPEADPNVFGPAIEYELADGEKVAGGSWAALEPATGAFDWQVATPGGAAALAPPSAADGVVFVGSMASAAGEANMLALEAATGKTLWSFQAEGSVVAGPAIVDGTVYWGDGYGRFGLKQWTGAHTLYAFSLEGK
ncbi:MAG TPA: PQQ-binding-like beta-propeller repeat protein [Solirubrobacteraceae bacterium]|nr:PQQ-binding-like beta-propeller repeat protein [Solirubrobacteraceae bacterium]